MSKLLAVAFPLIFGLLLCAFGALMLYVWRLMRADDRQIAAEGVDGEAEVTDQRTIHGRGSSNYYLTFRYTVQAPGKEPETLTQETEVSGPDYQRLPPGAKVAIRYLPTAPKEVSLRGGVRPPGTPKTLIGGLGGIVGGVLLIVLSLYILAH